MSMRRFLAAFVFATVALCATIPAFARVYQITVQGSLNIYSATLFQNSVQPIPVTFSFNVNSDDAAFLQRGAPFNSYGYSFNTDSYRIPKSAIVGLNVVIGNATFTEADLITQGLDLAGTYDILVMGGFEQPSAINMSFTNATFGELYIGALSCPTTTCSIIAAGSAFSYQDGGFGEFVSITVTSSTVDTNPEQKIGSSISLLDGMNIASRGVKASLNAKLQAALRVLKVNDAVASKNILGALEQRA